MKRSRFSVQACLGAFVLSAVVFAVPARAQDKPRFETYGGYSILKLNLPNKEQPDCNGLGQRKGDDGSPAEALGEYRQRDGGALLVGLVYWFVYRRGNE